MNYKNHVFSTAGISIIVCFLLQFSITESLIFLGLASFASLWPDIDMAHSKISSLVFPVITLVVCIGLIWLLGLSAQTIVLIILTLILLGIIYNRMMKHRGFTHTIPFAILAALPFLFFGALEAIAIAFGITMHILEDILCDKTGIGRGGRK